MTENILAASICLQHQKTKLIRSIQPPYFSLRTPPPPNQTPENDYNMPLEVPNRQTRRRQIRPLTTQGWSLVM